MAITVARTAMLNNRIRDERHDATTPRGFFFGVVASWRSSFRFICGILVVGMDPSPPMIDYEPHARKRAWRRRLVRYSVMVLLVVLAGFGWMNRDEISLRARRIYWAYQCLNHVTPPGTKLVESDPIKANALVDSNSDYYHFIVIQPNTRIRQPAYYSPAAFREYCRLLPPAWPFYAIGSNGARLWSFSRVYLGGRSTPSGTTRIVTISCSPGGYANRVEYEVLPPPTLLGSVQPRDSTPKSFEDSRFSNAILQPGRSDPADPTHLMIDYTMKDVPNKTGTIDVHLTDDDTLNFHFHESMTPRASQ
jgi:hypothetical protein